MVCCDGKHEVKSRTVKQEQHSKLASWDSFNLANV